MIQRAGAAAVKTCPSIYPLRTLHDAVTCDNVDITVSTSPALPLVRLLPVLAHLKCHPTVYKTATTSSAPLFVACPSRRPSHPCTLELTHDRHDCQKTYQYLDLIRQGCFLVESPKIRSSRVRPLQLCLEGDWKVIACRIAEKREGRHGYSGCHFRISRQAAQASYSGPGQVLYQVSLISQTFAISQRACRIRSCCPRVPPSRGT